MDKILRSKLSTALVNTSKQSITTATNTTKLLDKNEFDDPKSQIKDGLAELEQLIDDVV